MYAPQPKNELGLDDGSTGRLVPSSDPRALGEALLEFFSDRAAAHRMGVAARAECERRFSLDRMVADYTAVYDQLLATCGTRPLAVAAPER